jgi:hypothetical protein
MLNYIKEYMYSVKFLLAVSIPRVIIALVVLIVLTLICFNIANRLVNGIRKGTFLITDTWKIGGLFI